MISVAVMGFGTVGSGVVEVIENHSKDIEKKIGQAINVKYILDVRDFSNTPYADKVTKNYDDILNDKEVSIVVECIGHINPAFDFTKRLLQSGKSVVTSNKELVAEKGAELLKLAYENNVNYLFEASVGGGIPIIRPINQCLSANEIFEIVGILNGTTNYILTQMVKNNKDFGDALIEAQSFGYAEADPTADIEGYDVRRKIAILCSITFGWHFNPNLVHTEGITKITKRDLEYAEQWGSVIKLIGRARKIDNNRVNALVSPCFVKKANQLSNVEDVFNAILLKGDAIGDVMFYGRGAGKYPTASAVVADVIDAAKHIKDRKWLHWQDIGNDKVVDYLDMPVRYYVLIENNNNENEKAEKIFNISDKLCSHDGEFAFITNVYSSEREFIHDLEKSEAGGVKVISKIRVITD